MIICWGITPRLDNRGSKMRWASSKRRESCIGYKEYPPAAKSVYSGITVAGTGSCWKKEVTFLKFFGVYCRNKNSKKIKLNGISLSTFWWSNGQCQGIFAGLLYGFSCVKFYEKPKKLKEPSLMEKKRIKIRPIKSQESTQRSKAMPEDEFSQTANGLSSAWLRHQCLLKISFETSPIFGFFKVWFLSNLGKKIWKHSEKFHSLHAFT